MTIDASGAPCLYVCNYVLFRYHADRMLTAEQRQLVEKNRGIAIRVLQRNRIRGAGYDDAKGEAMLALCRAAVSFDPSKAGFSTWAWLKVDGAVKDWLERERRASGAIRSGLLGFGAHVDGAPGLVDSAELPDQRVFGAKVEAAAHRLMAFRASQDPGLGSRGPLRLVSSARAPAKPPSGLPGTPKLRIPPRSPGNKSRR